MQLLTKIAFFSHAQLSYAELHILYIMQTIAFCAMGKKFLFLPFVSRYCVRVLFYRGKAQKKPDCSGFH